MIATLADRSMFFFFYFILRSAFRHPDQHSITKQSILEIKSDPERRHWVRMQVLSCRLLKWKLRHLSTSKRRKLIGNDTVSLASILRDNPFLYKFVLKEFQKKPLRGTWCVWIVRSLLFEYYSKLKVMFEPEEPAYRLFERAAASFRGSQEAK